MTAQDQVPMRLLTDEELEYMAYHEAGHLTVGLILTPEVISGSVLNREVASIRLSTEDRRTWGGYVSTKAVAEMTDELIEKLSVFYAAGKVGEIVSQRTGAECSDERDRLLLKELAAQHSAFARCQAGSESLERKLEAFRLAATEQAREIILAEDRLFYALAADLRAQRKLIKSELLQLLKDHRAGGYYAPVLF